MKNLLIGNGVNIKNGGFEFSNTAIILRTLKQFKDPDFPKHVIVDDPVLAKCYIGYLYLEIGKFLNNEYDRYAFVTVEKEALEEFKQKYSRKTSLKITDIGFEDYYLIHDLLCHRIKMGNPERYTIREAIKLCFLHAIFDSGFTYYSGRIQY